ncbi:MAG: NAD(P)/FAD-dependent oxidoreductase [Prevotellaceae bacterium]|jgi:all-trans-retinol 13,14-reductase|nr:NAD(P)/FAD-dependent oxidoreductase [Prevotellaceae bacterium]
MGAKQAENRFRIMKYDVIIIGSGLGGLECGYILSKKGYKVCILEKNAQVGGCMQSFRRGKCVFDTGFHYVGGLDEGQPLHRLFDYFDLLDLPWHKLDESAFAEVIIAGKPFFLASGHKRFVDTLADDFPHQRQQLKSYTDFLKQIGDNIFDSFTNDFGNSALFENSAYLFLQQTVNDPLLRNILSGGSQTMELCSDKLPLYVFAQINNSFIQSTWKLKGDGSMIANKLADYVRSRGGEIITKAKVTRLIETDGRISSVEYNEDKQITCKYVISNAHPSQTLALIPESRNIRKLYRNRISSIPNTFGMFTVHLQLKKSVLPYLNRNIFVYENDSIWDYKRGASGTSEETTSILICYRPPVEGVYMDSIDILSPMYWDEVARWSDTDTGKRGDDYEAFKLRKAEACIELASTRIPELNNNIEKIYTSTPLTYRDYTGTPNGSAYGVRKDYNDTLGTIIVPQTQIPNLFLSGQNLNLHGILGVSMTSFFTCAKIVGMNNLIKDFI